jgi:L-alanine-DL-glutamate epimerase-like enolase superfamily enzyme
LINEITLIRGAIPLSRTDPVQLWTEEWSNQLFVKVRVGERVGWGETLPAAGNTREPYIKMIERLRERIVDENEAKISELWMTMRKMTFTGGYGVTTGAISGIDIALWDMRGKKNSAPIFKLLRKNGSSSGKEIPRYASLSRYSDNAKVLSAVEKLVKSGYSSIKIHQTPEQTLDAVRRIRQSIGKDFDLMVDLNCGFPYDKAREFMQRVDRFDLKWVEEPVWPPDDFESLKKLNKLGAVAAGENFFSYHEFKQLLEEDAISFYQPDVAKCGGITALSEMMELFNTHKAKVALHNRPHNGWIGIIASTHIATASDLDVLIESPPNEIPNDFFRFGGAISKDKIRVKGSGLGLSPVEPIPENEGSKLLHFH